MFCSHPATRRAAALVASAELLVEPLLPGHHKHIRVQLDPHGGRARSRRLAAQQQPTSDTPVATQGAPHARLPFVHGLASPKMLKAAAAGLLANKAAGESDADDSQQGGTASSSMPPQHRHDRAAFRAWQAARAHPFDVALPLAELLIISLATLTKSLSALQCDGLGADGSSAGPPDAAAARALAVPHFPCAAGLPGRLLYVLRTLSFANPRVFHQLRDFGMVAYVSGLLACTGLALACRLSSAHGVRAWARWRNRLLVVARLAGMLGQLTTALVAPTPNLVVSGAGFLGAHLGRSGVTCHLWRALVTARVSCMRAWFTALWPGGCVSCKAGNSKFCRFQISCVGMRSTQRLSKQHARTHAVRLCCVSPAFCRRPPLHPHPYVPCRSDILQVPADVQLFAGVTEFVVITAAACLVDWRLLPGAGRVVPPLHALRCFFLLAVLPYALLRAWEQHTTAPAFRAHMRAQRGGGSSSPDVAVARQPPPPAAAAAAVSGCAGSSACGGGATGSTTSGISSLSGTSSSASSVEVDCVQIALPHQPAVPPPAAVSSNPAIRPAGSGKVSSSGSSTQAGTSARECHTAAATPAPARSRRPPSLNPGAGLPVVDTRGALVPQRAASASAVAPILPYRSRCRSRLVSVKVQGPSHLHGDAVSFGQASRAVLHGAAAVVAGRCADAPGTRPRVQVLGAVCVEGCVQLLMLVRVEDSEEEEEAGEEGGLLPRHLPPLHADVTLHASRHAGAWDCNTAGQQLSGVAQEPLRRLLEAVAATNDDEVAKGADSSDPVTPSMQHASICGGCLAGAAAAQPAPLAAVWPAAVAVGQQRPHSGGMSAAADGGAASATTAAVSILLHPALVQVRSRV